MPIELRTSTPDETRSVGEAMAGLLRPGDAVVLTGELGAGKTTLVQGVARGLGVEDTVGSPTFVLVREYRGRLDLSHVDVYRLDRVQDVIDLGLDELFGGEGVLLVEWGDAIEDLLPPDRLRVELRMLDPDGSSDARRVAVSFEGSTWAERWDALARKLAAWEGAGP